MNAAKFKLCLMALHFIVAWTVVAISGNPAHAQRGGNGGGKGGGGDAAYEITPFMPPDVTSVSSGVGDLNEVGEAVGWMEMADGSYRAIHRDPKKRRLYDIIGQRECQCCGRE